MRRLGLMLLAVVRHFRLLSIDDDDHRQAGREWRHRSGNRRQRGRHGAVEELLSGDQADKKTSADVQLFGPEQAQAAAAAMGVRFVSGEPVKTAEVGRLPRALRVR